MISPVPSTGSGKVSMASGDPNALRTAAFMIILLAGEAIMIADFPIAGRPGIILGLDGPSQVFLPSEGVMVMADPRRSEFGDFLRSRREKLSPKAVGLPGGRRRRTAGRRWDVLAWNSAADEIFAFSRLAEEDRNTLMSVLTNPHTRGLFGSAWAD